MSHTTVMKNVEFSSADYLSRAVEELKKQGADIELVKGGTPRAYFNNQAGMGQADFVLKINSGPYDVGFYRNAEGKLEPRCDLFGGHISRVLGHGGGNLLNENALSKLSQMYGVVATTQEAAKRGRSVTRQIKADGTISLIISNFN